MGLHFLKSGAQMPCKVCQKKRQLDDKYTFLQDFATTQIFASPASQIDPPRESYEHFSYLRKKSTQNKPESLYAI